MDGFPVISRRYSLTADFLILWFLLSFCLLFPSHTSWKLAMAWSGWIRRAHRDGLMQRRCSLAHTWRLEAWQQDCGTGLDLRVGEDMGRVESGDLPDWARRVGIFQTSRPSFEV